jgi:hypothetical protein
MKQIISRSKYFFLLIVPLLVILYQQCITKNVYFSDPDYAYILNGLNINIHKLPIYSDHPGVPLTLLSALGIRIIYWFSGSSMDIQSDVLTNPAYYEMRLQVILFSLIIAVALFTGYYIYKITRNFFIGIVSQAIPFLFSSSLAFAAENFMPDVMLIAIFHLFLVLIAQYVVKEIRGEDTKIEMWLFPILCGLGLSVKLIILPILVLPILLLRMRLKKIFYFSTITVLSFVVFTIPVVKQYPYMFKWFFSLFVHSGIYGSGSATFINPENYFKNILFIITNDHLMTLMMIFSVILLGFFLFLRHQRKFQIDSILYKLLISAIIAQVLSILIVSKHFEGKSTYLIVTYALTALSFAVSAIILIKYLKLSKQSIAILLVFFLAFSIFVNLSNYKNDFLSWSMTKKECVEVQQFLASHSDYNIVTKNAYSINKNQALLFGLAFSRVHEERLMELYPNTFFYNVIQGKFSHWYKQIPTDQIFINGKVLLVDTYLNDDEKSNFEKMGYTANLLFSNRIKAVYKLSELNPQQHQARREALILEKMKSIYSDEKWLNTIKVKAREKGIHLDSMVYLDAKWMIDTYGK